MNSQGTQTQHSAPLRPGGRHGLSRLVVVANTGAAPHALHRAALLPLAQGAEVSVLLGGASTPLPGGGVPASRLGEAGASLEARVRAQGGRVSVLPLASDEDTTSGVERQSALLHAELVVLERTPKGLLASLRGTPPEKLVRHGHVPALIVHRPAEVPYHRILVGVDLSEVSRAALRMALQVHTPQHGPVDVLHVYDTSYALVMHQTQLTTEPLLAYYGQRRHEAEAALRDFLGASQEWEGANLRRLVASGDPADELKRVVKESGVDLLVLGKSDKHGLGHTLLGSVAEGCVRSVACDVLVVPEARVQAVH